MNAEERAHWLQPSPPLAVDDTDRPPAEPATHAIRLRDLRERFGDELVVAAECECGWLADAHTGEHAWRLANRDGKKHVEAHRPERVPGKSASPSTPAG